MRFIFIQLFLYVSFFTNAQSSFSKVYFSEELTTGLDVVETSDKGFLILGDTSAADGYRDIYLIKTDSLGEKQWTRSFGYVGYSDSPHSMINTYDGGYLITGDIDKDNSASGTSPYPIMYKLDSVFNIEWYREQVMDMGTAWCRDVVQTPDSGYLFMGKTVVGGSTLMKTDKNGATQWLEQFGLTFNDYVNSVKKTTDGGYILAGASDAFGGPNRIMARKLDSTFTEEWIRFYGDTTITVAVDIIELLEGGFALTGNKDVSGDANYDALVMKIASNGDSLWLKTYGGNIGDGTQRGVSLVELDDSSLLVSVRIPIEELANGNGILKIAANGDSLWLKPIGGGAAGKLAKTRDGGVVVTGMFWDTYGFNKANAMLIKLDSTCYFEDLINGVADLQYENEALKLFPNPFSTQATMQFNNPNNEQYNFVLYDSFGRAVWQETTNANEFSLQRENLPSGIYFYQLTGREKRYWGKVVIR
jgi:hypothetical protein